MVCVAAVICGGTGRSQLAMPKRLAHPMMLHHQLQAGLVCPGKIR